MAKPENPPLFWQDRGQGEEPSEITLRDLFAAAALAGYRAKPEWTFPSEETSEQCYRDADHMLAERAKASDEK